MEGHSKLSIKLLTACLVLGLACGYERRVSRGLTDISRLPGFNGRFRRQAPPFPTSRGDSGDQYIPKIAPAPPGSILSYDGKPVSTSVGAYSIVPKTERRTPSINLNRPQFGTYRGVSPPPIPDYVPKDLPQFKKS